MPIVATLKGDLVALTKAGLFDGMIHGANCFTTMGSGIAKTVKEVFPHAYEVDCQTKYGSREKLGTYSLSNVYYPEQNCCPDVFNLYTQYSFGIKDVDLLEYEALEKGMKAINKDYGDLDNYKLGIPLIGCGLAGGDWNRAKDIINKATPDLSIFVVLYDDKF